MLHRLGKVLPVGCLIAVVWINAYICRQIFRLEYTGQMHSMHGFWMAMARLAGSAWYKPSWWPYWFGGMPFEFTYAPAVPFLAAVIAHLGGISVAQAFNVVCGLVFCFGPAALFLMSWQLTKRLGWSFMAAAVYSLSSLSELVVPDEKFDLQHVGDARRFYVCFVWDEVPHQLALALASLAILCFVLGFRRRTRAPFLCAGIFTAGSVMANAFGGTILAIALACLLVTCETAHWKWNLRAAAVCCLIAYLVVSPFLPPSLLQAISANSNLFPESAFTPASLQSLAGVIAGGALLWWLARKAKWHLRFFLLLAYSFTMIPVLQKYGLHFVPQPGRYKVEMEFAIALLLVFALAAALDRFPKTMTIVLLLWSIPLGWRQIVLHRRFAKDVLRPVAITGTIEYQVARWVESALPGERVMAPGSIAQWMNAFTAVPQLSGGSYPTAPTTIGQVVVWGILGAGDHAGGLTALWMKAYGTDAVIVSGKQSPEFWRPFQGKQQFEGTLPVLWRDRDTTVYALPRRNRSLAAVIPETAAVRRQPRNLADDGEVRRYVAALDAAALPPAGFQWLDVNHAAIQAAVATGQAIAVQVTWHPGWKAVSNAQAVPISRDGLGQMILHARCPDGCRIELTYDGGWEGRLTRGLSLMTMLGVAGAFLWKRSRMLN